MVVSRFDNLFYFSGFLCFYQNKIRQIKKEETLKTAFNQRLAKVEMTALRSQMNPHFIFNCLSSINRFILVNQPEIASEYLTKFARLIRLVLDNSRSELIPLSNELQALRLYIEMEQMRFANRFEFIENIDSTVKTEHFEIPPLLIQPFVENAIWHGLMPQEKAGILKIYIFLNNENLQIEIEDNGIGRKEAATYKNQNHQSHATQITQERFEIVRQAYQIEASVDILDLYDAAGTAIGTKVILKLKK
ncbi:MAG: histidine kinase [Saprospiraceae bacterium]|nr:histidine kinase [Saprospiraceae bacterium]